MTLAALYGAGSGALHAVTGPDHLLSLGPVALRKPPAPWRIGLLWGAGHALGTLFLGIPAMLLAQIVHLPTLAAWGNRFAGAALLLTALWSAWSRRASQAASLSPAPERRPLWVGLVHGVTGAAGLLLVLPVLVSGSPLKVLVFLGAFALGSTLAMAGMTSALALLGGSLGKRIVRRSQTALTAASLAVGAAWLLGF